MRVALVGYGLAGRAFHAPFIAATAGIELTAIVTSDPQRRAHAEAVHPGAVLVESTEALWAAVGDLGVELAVVAAPNRAHVPVALAALEAGLGVVVDKPLAATAEAGQRIVAEAERRGLFLSVFHNRRWDGDFLTVRRLVEAGELGPVWRFESRYERWRPDREPDAWRERAGAEDAGGLLADLGSHLIDQALVLFGPARTVYAELDRRRDGITSDDDSFVSITHANGVRSHLWMSLVAAEQGPRFRVLGSKGAFVKEGYDVQEAPLRDGATPGGAGWGVEPETAWGALHDGERVRTIPTLAGNYGAFYAGLARALREDAPPPVDPMDSVAALYVIEAALQSARDRTVVALH